MAETRHLFIPEDSHFIRQRTKDKPLMEEVLVDQDYIPEPGEEPETEFIPVIRSFEFFVETYITSHPIFDIRRGYAAAASALRIIDIVRDAAKGEWAEFAADDARRMKKVFSAPEVNSSKSEEKQLSAADMREMSSYEMVQYRTFIESIMNPRTTKPEEPASELASESTSESESVEAAS